MKEIQIPQSNAAAQITMKIQKNMVIIGANGSGKSRFGSKLEQINNPSKRISAQRYLQLNEVVQKQDYDTADTQLRSSYKNQSPIQPQNDFQQVLISLFAEESRRNEKVIGHIQTSGEIKKADLPKSVKEEVMEIWNFVFPNRLLKLEKDRVRAAHEGSEFSGAEMSDGEKVSLYLISQILLAEKNCVLIIDEPELHLHKALMVRLWNKLEERRSDCAFIYITHDLDFAVSKPANKIIWIKSFNDGHWEWSEIDPNEIIPENLFLEILGSRKPVLFVEGEKGSLDIQIYQSYYEDYTVVPRGSCDKVIESVKGLKSNPELHGHKVYGLIDRDFRPDAQITVLQADGVHCVVLNEVENVLLLPEVINVVCTHLLKTEKKEAVIQQIRDLYEADRDRIAFSSSKYQIQRLLNEKFGAVRTKEEYETFKSKIIADMDSCFSSASLPEKNSDIIDILKVYPNKGLTKQVQGHLELNKNGYKNLVVGLLVSEKRAELVAALGKYLPKII